MSKQHIMDLSSLPDLVLIGIISHVISSKDILSLSLQCHRLHDFCDMKTRKKYHKVRLQTAKDTDRAFNMLLSILRRPQYGLYVGHVELPGDQHRLYSEPYYRLHSGGSYGLEGIFVREREISDSDLKLLRDAVQRVKVKPDQTELLMTAITKSPTRTLSDSAPVPISHAVAVLLMSVCPNLESFSFCQISSLYTDNPVLQSPRNASCFLPDFIECASENPTEVPYLHNLRYITCLNDSDSIFYTPADYEDYNVSESMRVISALPHVERFTASGITSDENPQSDLLPRSSNISHICIHHSFMPSHLLSTLIGSCKKLNVFEYSMGGKNPPPEVGGEVDLGILLSLKAHEDTLRVLDMDVDGDYLQYGEIYHTSAYDPEYDHERWEQCLSDSPAPLTSFSAMTHLSAGIYLLMLFAKGRYLDDNTGDETFSLIDSLPPNLEFLCIRGYEPGENEEFDTQISNLMRHKDRRPLLKEISGVDQHIPHSESIEDANDGECLAWQEETQKFEEFEEAFS